MSLHIIPFISFSVNTAIENIFKFKYLVYTCNYLEGSELVAYNVGLIKVRIPSFQERHEIEVLREKIRRLRRGLRLHAGRQRRYQAGVGLPASGRNSDRLCRLRRGAARLAGLAGGRLQRDRDLLRRGLHGRRNRLRLHWSGANRDDRSRLQDQPGSPATYRCLAACYAHMGRLDEARVIVARLRAITPQVMLSDPPYRNPEDRELFLSGLRLAMGEAE